MMTLIRKVNLSVRYYKINLIENLFREWTVSVVFGSIKNVKPTGEKKYVFTSYPEAQKAFSRMVKMKLKKGYMPKERYA